jgi:tetratricopeptide (TPR) repeat protein
LKRKPHKDKQSAAAPGIAAGGHSADQEPSGGKALPSPSTTKPLSKGRKFVFGLVGFVVLPLLLLAGLELVLRVAGFGYPVSFFKPIQISNADFLVENDKFGLRFFPPELARSPAPVIMTAKKRPGTYRIFVLGESAALGDPRPAYGAGRYLQAMLRERYPDKSFEVVCLAITAINSHAILPIAQECAKHEGDLWIVYMGNNEMVGPFGATTIFGSQSPPLAYVRLSLALQEARLGQMLMMLGRKLTGAGKHGPSWGGMKMFIENRIGPADPRKEIVYQNFRRNLEDILQAGRRAGVPVLLNTVAVNLEDSPPFASLLETNLPASQREAYDKAFAAGWAAERQGDWVGALALLEPAVRVEPQCADLQFQIGTCLMRLTNALAARAHFQKACDFDALPFRADSRINELVREADRRQAGSNLVLLDAEVALRAGTNRSSASPAEPQASLFYEHVHLNFDGNYKLARLWADAVERFLPAARLSPSQAVVPWATQEVCERRLGLTDWNRASVLEDMIRRLSQAPFTNQANHDARLADFRVRLAEIRKRMDIAGAADAREVYVEALRPTPDDHRLHENFAEFLEGVGDLPAAAAEWERVRELLPHHHLAYFQAGRLLVLQGKLAESQPLLLKAVALRPDLSEGWLELGRIHASESKHELALGEYERARALLPQDSRVHYYAGRTLSKMNRRSEAIAELTQAATLRPDYWEARYALGEELAFDGKGLAARKEFEQVIRLKPNYPMAHFNLAVALFQQGQTEDAIREFEETCRLDPENKQAAEYLRKIKSVKGLKK